MKNSFVLLLLAVAASVSTAMAQVGFGQARLFDDGWEFSLAGADFRAVDLPHDWSIEATPSRDLASCTGYLPGGVGVYRKTFSLDQSQHARWYIYFEGVYNRSEVTLNGHLLGKRPNGYISFMYDMTPYLTSGQNTLEVKVDHSRHADSRWYTGSGIYRDVWIVGSGETHFAQWGVTYTYEPKRRALHIKAPVEGKDKGLVRRATLLDGTRTVASVETKKAIFDLPYSEDLTLWSIDKPYLYTLKVELLRQGQLIDETTIRAGFRTLEFSADHGFALNGENMKVKGVCIHHDAGVLGSVVPRDVWKRRLLALKEMGANAIRMSHNPQAPVVYDLCDEMGFLVMDEGSDEWEFPKRKWVEGWNVGTPAYDGTYDFFEEWIETDVADMVRRDRNHPCIFLWSVGNEVDYPNDPYSHPILDGKNSKINQPMFGGYKPDAPQAERIGKIAKRLAAVIRREDTSRPVTGALAGVVMSNETEYPEAVDVVGYNYTEDRYEQDHKTYPKRILYGSETKAGKATWDAVRDHEFIFGQFIWTGLDYLGESGAWPSRGLGTGLIDFMGFLKPAGIMQKMIWSGQPIPDRKDRKAWREMMPQEGTVREGKVHELRVTDVTVEDDSPVRQLLVEAVDKEGRRIPNAEGSVRCFTGESAQLLGLETGDNTDMSAPKSGRRRLYQGRLLAYIKGEPTNVGFILVDE